MCAQRRPSSPPPPQPTHRAPALGALGVRKVTRIFCYRPPHHPDPAPHLCSMCEELHRRTFAHLRRSFISSRYLLSRHDDERLPRWHRLHLHLPVVPQCVCIKSSIVCASVHLLRQRHIARSSQRGRGIQRRYNEPLPRQHHLHHLPLFVGCVPHERAVSAGSAAMIVAHRRRPHTLSIVVTTPRCQPRT